MSADGFARRIVKRVLRPLLPEPLYAGVLAAAKARDIRGGKWSEPEIDLLPAALHPGETAIDVGANYGLYTWHLSRAVGPAGRVVAFEPVPEIHAVLERVARRLRLGNVELVPRGCGEIAGRVELELPLQRSGAVAGGLAHVAGRRDRDALGADPDLRTRCISAELVRLDDAIPPTTEVALIKIDVEGMELSVLRGAWSLIERCAPTLVCEVDSSFLEGYGVDPRSLFEELRRRGYRALRYLGTHRRLVEEGVEPVTAGNRVFLHPSRASRLEDFLTGVVSPVSDRGRRS